MRRLLRRWLQRFLLGEYVEYVASAHVIELEPGDILVIESPAQLSTVTREILRGRISVAFGIQCLILDDGMRAGGVIRKLVRDA